MTDRFEARADETPLWVRGKLALWVEGPDTPGHMITLNRPHAVVGRLSTCDVVVPHQAVGSRHLYFHLDRRGLFGVDLASRTGTRFPPIADTAGDATGRIAWLRVGDVVEIADHKIEIVKARTWTEGEIDDSSLRLPRLNDVYRSFHAETLPRPPAPNPLADAAANAALVSIALVPRDRSSPPSELTSELIFIGKSVACGLRVDDPNLARVEGVLVRSEQGAFLVVFGGDRVRVDDRAVPRTAALTDGSTLSIGDRTYEIRLSRHADRPRAAVLGASASAGHTALATIDPHRFIAQTHASMTHDHASEPIERRSEPVEILSTALQSGASAETLLAWMMGAMQSSQAELARRQTSFQQTIVELVQKSRVEHYELMRAQLERIEKIDEEIVTLRTELQKHLLKEKRVQARLEVAAAERLRESVRSASEQLTESAAAERLRESVRSASERLTESAAAERLRESVRSANERLTESAAAERLRESVRSASEQGAAAGVPEADLGSTGVSGGDAERPRRPAAPVVSGVGGDSTLSAAWLIERINRLDRENRASRKTLLERLTSLGKPAT